MIVTLQIVFGIPVLIGFFALPGMRAEMSDPVAYGALRSSFLAFSVLFFLSVLAGLFWRSHLPSTDNTPESGRMLRAFLSRAGIMLTAAGLGLIVSDRWTIGGTFLLLIGVVLIGLGQRYP